MNIDLAAVTGWLASLGPWGPYLALAAAVFGPVLYRQAKKRWPNLFAAPTPAKPADPAAPTDRPVIDGLLASLRRKLADRFPGRNADDLLHDQLLAQIAHVGRKADRPADDPPAVAKT